MSKVFAGETAVRVTEEAIQILGGYGYVRDNPVERWHRDSKIYTIFEGTSEIQRLVISRAISGHPHRLTPDGGPTATPSHRAGADQPVACCAVIAREQTEPSSGALPDPDGRRARREPLSAPGGLHRERGALGHGRVHARAPGRERGLALEIATAGTHTIDGQPMSGRTRAALRSIPALADGPHGRHRSRQVHEPDLEAAALVVAMEADHVRYVRRRHPRAAGRTATLRRLVAALPPGRPPSAERVAALAARRSAGRRRRGRRRSGRRRRGALRGLRAPSSGTSAGALVERHLRAPGPPAAPSPLTGAAGGVSRRGPSAGRPRPGRPAAGPAARPLLAPPSPP